MAIFPMPGVLRGFLACGVLAYASAKILARPWSSKKFLIYDPKTLNFICLLAWVTWNLYLWKRLPTVS
jgi:hypothetical protein